MMLYERMKIEFRSVEYEFKIEYSNQRLSDGSAWTLYRVTRYANGQQFVDLLETGNKRKAFKRYHDDIKRVLDMCLERVFEIATS